MGTVSEESHLPRAILFLMMQIQGLNIALHLIEQQLSIEYFFLTFPEIKWKYQVAQEQGTLGNEALAGVAMKQEAKLKKASD